jgi:methyl-accepting chemotaxis protein
MKRLNQQQVAQIEELEQQIEEARDLAEQRIEDMNEAINELRSLAEELADDAEGYYDERSESWQESDRGDDYQSWIDEWRELADSLEDAELNAPEYNVPGESPEG